MQMDTAHEPTAHADPKVIKWDDASILKEMANFPEELRADYRWLKTACRDRFQCNPSLLEEAFKKVGVYRTVETLRKILKGRFLNHGRKDRTAYPIVNADTFAREIEALRTNTREEALRGRIPFVLTTTAQSIFDYIDDRCQVDRVNKFGFVVGHTGTQKTASFKEYERLHDNVWWTECPETGNPAEFSNRLGKLSGLKKHQSRAQINRHLFEVVKADKCIVFDNAQDLYQKAWGNQQPNLTLCRRLQDETNCTIIFSITPYFKEVLLGQFMADYFEQFIGRSGGQRIWLTLTEHAPDEDVGQIAAAFGLRDHKKHLAELRAISREPGRIRRLFEDLQGGKQLAAGDALTIDHIRDYREE